VAAPSPEQCPTLQLGNSESTEESNAVNAVSTHSVFRTHHHWLHRITTSHLATVTKQYKFGTSSSWESNRGSIWRRTGHASQTIVVLPPKGSWP